jgi:hypothetical protein
MMNQKSRIKLGSRTQFHFAFIILHSAFAPSGAAVAAILARQNTPPRCGQPLASRDALTVFAATN